MDAFYASVEARYNSDLRDKPVVVGADPKGGHGRGVVTAASYAARRYGIRSAMPISRAWRLAEAARRRGEPATVFIPGNRKLYAEASERIMALLAPNADAFEEASIDEAYLDLSSLGSFEAAAEHARSLKREIDRREGLTCSVGIGPNKLVAKIASDFKKPDGLTVVRPAEVQEFLDPLPIRVIPGIGPKTEGLLNEWEPKSIGEQETFEVDTLDAAFVLERVRELARDVFARLDRQGFRAFRTVTVTVRFADFRTLTRSHTPRAHLASEDALYTGAIRLLLPFLDHRENPR